MIRLLTAALALFATVATAMETPLTVTNASGSLMATISPTLGTMTMYRTNGVGTLDRKGSANFINDIAFLNNYIVSDRGDDVYSALRVGYGFNKPTPEEWISVVLGAIKSPKAAQAAGVTSLLERARNAEREFWAEEHPYDGVVRAALGDQYLMLVVPSNRAVMFYDVTNENFVLVAVTNFGPLLYLPHVFNSTPTPAELLSQLPQDVQDERRKQIEEQMNALVEQAEQGIKTQPSDVWVASAAGEKFIVLDIANLQLMSYEYAGKDLRVNAVRNIEVDLMIPAAFKSTPDLQGMYADFKKNKINKAFMEAEGIKDLVDFETYVQSRQGAGGSGGANKASVVQPAAVNDTGDLFIDFTDKRKLLSYRFGGGNTVIDLSSMRDYTLDAGIAMVEAEIRDRGYGIKFFELAKTNKNPAIKLRLIQSALRMNPPLYTMVEKDRRLVKEISELPEYEPMIQEATKKTEEMAAAREARIKASEEKKNKK